MDYSQRDLTSPAVIKNILNEHGFNFSKSLGQNYLIDRNIITKILAAADFPESTLVLEIGPGFGVLTRELCKKFNRVIAVEKDKSIPPILLKTVQDEALELIVEDIMSLDISDLIMQSGYQEAVIVANLPYNISTQIIMSVLEKASEVKSLIIMLQKEVAERILAVQGTKSYGALSVGVNYFAEPKIISKVSRGSFMPAPKVDSAIIRLDRKKRVLNSDDEREFFKVVRAIFGKRRKTLVNSLAGANICDKETAKSVIMGLGYNADIRGETLCIGQMIDISKLISGRRGNEEAKLR